LWVFKPYIKIFCGFFADFGGFWPFLGDLEPKKRPDLGETLGFDSQLKFYKKPEVLGSLRRFIIAEL
jgi:hypothetical protein